MARSNIVETKKLQLTVDVATDHLIGEIAQLEVKPYELLMLEKNQEKFNAVGEYFRRRGHTFITMSERGIRHPVWTRPSQWLMSER